MTKPEGVLCQTYYFFPNIQTSVGAQWPAYGPRSQVSGSSTPRCWRSSGSIEEASPFIWACGGCTLLKVSVRHWASSLQKQVPPLPLPFLCSVNLNCQRNASMKYISSEETRWTLHLSDHHDVSFWLEFRFLALAKKEGWNADSISARMVMCARLFPETTREHAQNYGGGSPVALCVCIYMQYI